MDFRHTIAQALRRMRRVATPAIGQFVEAPDAGRIDDGVDYRLPVLMPRYLERALRASGKFAESVRRDFDSSVDAPYKTNDTPVDLVFDDPLREPNPATRERILTSSHAAYQRNPMANRGCKYMAAFVVGEGFNLTCKNKEVERFLDAFIDHPENDIRAYEAQAIIDLQVDGELFLRFFAEGADVRMVPLRPWECQYIATEKGFFRRPLYYHFVRTLTEGDAPTGGQSTETENIPAEDILHVAINRHGYELRGRPELFSALPWLKAHKDWLENRARQNYWRGALLWFVQVAGATSTTLAAVAARWRKPPAPGSVAIETDKTTVTALTNPVSAGDVAEDGRQIKLMAAVGMGLPEYFLGDGENANLATTKSQQLPAMTTFGAFQRLMIEKLWYPVFKRVLQAAIDAGDLPEDVEEQDADGDTLYEEPDEDEAAPAQEAFPPSFAPNGSPPAPRPMLPAMPEPRKVARTVATLEAFDVSYEPLGDHEPFTLAQALQIAVQNEWVSNETASREMGYDPDIEAKKIKRERGRERDEMAQGLRQPPPGFMPPGMDAATDGEDEQPDAVQQTPA